MEHTAPGWILPAGAPALRYIDFLRQLLFDEGIFAEVSIVFHPCFIAINAYFLCAPASLGPKREKGEKASQVIQNSGFPGGAA